MLKKGKSNSRNVKSSQPGDFHSSILYISISLLFQPKEQLQIFVKNLGRKIQTGDTRIDDDCFSSFSKLTKFSERKIRLDGKRPKQRSSVEQLGNDFLNATHHSYLQELASDNRDSLQISAMAPIPY